MRVATDNQLMHQTSVVRLTEPCGKANDADDKNRRNQNASWGCMMKDSRERVEASGFVSFVTQQTARTNKISIPRSTANGFPPSMPTPYLKMKMNVAASNHAQAGSQESKGKSSIRPSQVKKRPMTIMNKSFSNNTRRGCVNNGRDST